MKRRRRLRRFRRKYIRPWWKDHQWKIIGGIALLAFILGYIGFHKHFIALGETSSPWNVLYRTIQLLVLEFGAKSRPVPWELELARLLLPAIAAYAAMRALIVIFWEHGPLLGRFKMVYCAPSLRIIGSIYINHFETPTDLTYVEHNPKKRYPYPLQTLKLP